MDENKFKCLRCGRCCKEFSTGKINGMSFQDSIKFSLNTPYLVLLDWEMDYFNSELKKIGSQKKIIPYTIFFDLSNNTSIVGSYTLEAGECPFFKEDGCTIYDKRPIICRTFPFLFDIVDIIFGNKNDAYMPKNMHCSSEKKDTFLDKISGTRIEILKILENRYGESYTLELGFIMFNKHTKEFLMNLEKNGRIRLARKGYNEKFLAKRIVNAKHIRLSEFYHKETNADIRLLFDVLWLKSYLKDKGEKFYFELANE